MTSMPQYRFVIDDGAELTLGDERMDLPNDHAAATEARKAIGELALELLNDGIQGEIRVAVENEAEEVVYQASLVFRHETAEQMAQYRRAQFDADNTV